MPKKLPYRGRFAPTPTGPLHLGSLVCAMASYLDAHYHQGAWLLRIDDSDQTRCRPGMDEQIIRTLYSLGFRWQEPIQYQHLTDYQPALDQLHRLGLLYACDCSRQQLRETAHYPGTCRDRKQPDAPGFALRVCTNDQQIQLQDRWQGAYSQRLARDCGDYIVRRRDGIMAYQLAVVVDDQQAQITHVVRGADLLDSTCRQIYLQQQLGYQTPTYGHVPLVIGTDGKKLSKSSAAEPLAETQPLAALRAAWDFLQPNRSPDKFRTVAEFWPWAMSHWVANL